MLSDDFAKNLNVELYNANSQTRKAEVKEPVQSVAPLLSLYEAQEQPKIKRQQSSIRRTPKVKQPDMQIRSLFDLEEPKAIEPNLEPRPFAGSPLMHYREYRKIRL